MSDRNNVSSQDSGAHPEPVLVFSPSTVEEAEIVRATLVAAGIPAFLKTPSGSPYLGEVDEVLGDIWLNGIYVSSADREAADAVLAAPPLSDEELSAAVDADETTLEEAEKKAKRD